MVPKGMGFPLLRSKDIEQRKLMKKKRERKKNSPVITVKNRSKVTAEQEERRRNCLGESAEKSQWIPARAGSQD